MVSPHPLLRALRRGFSLIEILIVCVILIALSAWLLPHYLGSGKSKPGEVVHTPMSRAHDVECMSNIRSVRQAIEAEHTGDADGKFPDALTSLRAISADLRKCAVGGEDYVYDPATGEVHCPHPGHEKY